VLYLPDTTIVNIAFTDLVRHFSSTGIGTLSWVLSSYTVLFAATLIPIGRLADRAPPSASSSLAAVFTTASALCGLAPRQAR
jgi:MFS family permease